jgi:hypothetical protein
MRKLFALVIVSTVLGCVGTLDETSGTDDTALDVAAPWYPHGPYGTAVGDTVENATFQGKSDTNGDGMVSDQSLRTIQLSDYARHGTSKTQVLLLSTCAQWCGPCNQEQGDLVALYQSYQASHPDKVKFVSVMAEDIRGGAATEATLNQWGNRNWRVSSTGAYVKIPYDLMIDPHAQTFVKYEDVPAYPFHLVVRTKGMTIAAKVAGGYPDQLQAAIDAVLAEPDQQ